MGNVGYQLWRKGLLWMVRSAPLLCFLCLVFPGTTHAEESTSPRSITLWHSYRDTEQLALERVVQTFNDSQDNIRVRALAMPHDSYASKLTTSIPRDNGPDLFVYAHERIGGWADSGIIAPLDEVTEAERQAFFPKTIVPLIYKGHLYGLPLAFKSVVLFYNKAIWPKAPDTTDELIAASTSLRASGIYGLAYQHEIFYFHAPWHFGFGASLFDSEGTLALTSPESLAAMAFVKSLQDRKFLPQEASSALVSQLFNAGKTASVISGPWFLGSIAENIDFGIATLPVVSSTGQRAAPFLSDEAIFVSAHSKSRADALVVARYLVATQSAQTRGIVGRQAVANREAWNHPSLQADAILNPFKEVLETTIPMESGPRMRSVWEPSELMLRKLLRRGASPADAANAGLRRFRAVTRPVPETADPTIYIVLSILLVLFVMALLIRSIGRINKGNRKLAMRGWSWIAPAMTGTVLLLFIPFIVGLVLALFAHRDGTWTFVGMSNFIEILTAKTYGPTEPLSFYFALAVTVLWTGANLVLHLGIGLSLAMLVAKPALKLRPVYRVLLIVPWAVPNYITALVWKGMFHRQFGAINGLLETLGIDEVAWFSSFWTAFFANVCANAWLGFPFMMVVCLGALQSIPKALYEAADVDGASGWVKFRHITLPLLRPALVPAVLIGTIWTFNQFNIVYLVSGGEPDNSTDILISEAYRWAFTRQEQYGYAAAYAALIFAILLGWSVFASRMNKRAEQA